MTTMLPTPKQLGDEVKRARLPDHRLVERLGKIVEAVARAPSASLPKILPSDAELEGAYRFLSNPRVHWRHVLAPHLRATAERARASSSDWLVVSHDTSTFHFGGTRGGLHQLDDGANFHGHFSLCLDLDRLPYGVLSVEVNTPGPNETKRRPGPKDAGRWWRNIVASERRLGRHAQRVVHVADREATSFDMMVKMSRAGFGFVFRSTTRRLVDLKTLEDGAPVRIHRCLEESSGTLLREVHISSRKTRNPVAKKTFPSRDARMAELHVRAACVVLRRPLSASKSAPETCQVNLVEVFEPNPPANEEPISWLLLTSESIDSLKDISRVVDAYRRRWVIEEYFKALKTGCAYEARHLESSHALLNTLALSVPVAWRLLLVRTMAHNAPTDPATRAFSEEELTLLRTISRRVRLPENPTLTDALLAIAGLGGHLKRNGAPGWQTLSSGYSELLSALIGWRAARQHVSAAPRAM